MSRCQNQLDVICDLKVHFSHGSIYYICYLPSCHDFFCGLTEPRGFDPSCPFRCPVEFPNRTLFRTKGKSHPIRSVAVWKTKSRRSTQCQADSQCLGWFVILNGRIFVVYDLTLMLCLTSSYCTCPTLQTVANFSEFNYRVLGWKTVWVFSF